MKSFRKIIFLLCFEHHSYFLGFTVSSFLSFLTLFRPEGGGGGFGGPTKL